MKNTFCEKFLKWKVFFKFLTDFVKICSRNFFWHELNFNHVCESWARIDWRGSTGRGLWSLTINFMSCVSCKNGWSFYYGLVYPAGITWDAFHSTLSTPTPNAVWAKAQVIKAFAKCSLLGGFQSVNKSHKTVSVTQCQIGRPANIKLLIGYSGEQPAYKNNLIVQNLNCLVN